ncbi:MAG TPA: phosphoribosyltransferase family protein, partial [Nitrolancea sp.]|nr:phosphoribosyltransferase family protein [Nitrolancea sp.]
MRRTFIDRSDAGHRLAAALHEEPLAAPVVLGIPRGGVAVSAVVARDLGVRHGVLVARKLRAPHQPELAIGAVSASGELCLDQELAALSGAGPSYVAEEKALQVAEARRRQRVYGGPTNPAVVGRTVIIVDDGIATGATAIAAIRAIRARGAGRVVFAAPVGSPHAVDILRHEADEVVCLISDSAFHSVGQYYENFGPVEDSEVMK